MLRRVSGTLFQLGVSASSVAGIYDRAYAVMATDAVRGQEAIEWGTGPDETVEVELDASVMAKWQETDGETGKRLFYYYCYMGARQRADISKLLVWPLGVCV